MALHVQSNGRFTSAPDNTVFRTESELLECNKRIRDFMAALAGDRPGSPRTWTPTSNQYTTYSFTVGRQSQNAAHARASAEFYRDTFARIYNWTSYSTQGGVRIDLPYTTPGLSAAAYSGAHRKFAQPIESGDYTLRFTISDVESEFAFKTLLIASYPSRSKFVFDEPFALKEAPVVLTAPAPVVESVPALPERIGILTEAAYAQGVKDGEAKALETLTADTAEMDELNAELEKTQNDLASTVQELAACQVAHGLELTEHYNKGFCGGFSEARDSVFETLQGLDSKLGSMEYRLKG